MKIFNHEFLDTDYGDDTSFFLKDKNSVFEILDIFYQFFHNFFSLVSGLSSNTKKCKMTNIGTLKGVSVVLCGIKFLNLTKETVKIFGVLFSHNRKLEHEMNFQSHIIKIESVLRL